MSWTLYIKIPLGWAYIAHVRHVQEFSCNKFSHIPLLASTFQIYSRSPLNVVVGFEKCDLSETTLSETNYFKYIIIFLLFFI